MGRVRNMNHLREKWSTRGKLSSSSSSEIAGDRTPNSSAASALSTQANGKKRSVATVETDTSAVAPRSEQRVLTATESHRFEVLSAWLQRNGIAYSARREDTNRRGSVFDDIYESLEDMETAVKLELAELLPKIQGSPATTPQQTRPSIVDYMVVIGPDIGDIGTKMYWQGRPNVYEASVIFAHPPHSQFTAECIEQFCFPYGIATHENDSDRTEDFFVLILSGGGDHGQSVQYACCLRRHIRVDGSFVYGDTPSTYMSICYAVVVGTPWIALCAQILRHIADRHQADLDALTVDDCNIVPNEFVQYIDAMMATITSVDPPAPGELMEFSINEAEPRHSSFSCLRPRIDLGCPENVELLLQWAMPHLLSCLSISRMVLVVSLLLIEMKVIVVSKKMPQLSAGTLGFGALLYPLVWAGPLISILPPSLHEYLEAPVPLLCGVDELPAHFIATKGTAILFMEDDEVQLHPEDGAQLGALQFPGSDELSRQLHTMARPLLALNQEDSRVLVANVVSRRIRRQLQDLLLLCARVNPCNAYACMKQEQLSLSETLFLKTFMQSQMYQKYSDDLPQDLPPQPENEMMQPAQQDPGPSSPAQARVSTSLRSSIRQLFHLSMTGSKGPENVLEDVGKNEIDGDAIIGSHGVDGSAGPSGNIPNLERSPKLASSRSPVETLGPEEVTPADRSLWRKRGSFSTDEASCLEGNNGENPSGPAAADVVAPASPTSHSLFRRVSSSTLSEGRSSRSQTELELQSFTPPWSPMSAKGLPLDQVSRDIGVSHKEVERTTTEQTLQLSRAQAARMIQTAWRRRRQRQQARQLKRRGSSSANLSRYTDSISASQDGFMAELLAGTDMILEHSDRALKVIMCLSEDSKSLVWRRGAIEVGRVKLVEIEEVKSEAGLILVQATEQRRYTFRSPPHHSLRVISFFQALHRLAMNTGRADAVDNETRSSADAAVNSPPLRHNSIRVETPSTARETSVHDSKRSAHEGIPLDERQSTFLSFDDAVRKGILVLKHGRMGRPHPKFLVCDEHFQILSWVDPRVTNAGFVPQSGSNLATKVTDSKSIRFDEIIDVCQGKKTRVFQRSSAGRSNSDLCFSIVTKQRTLDIETFSQADMSMLYDGIKRSVRSSGMSD